MGRINAKAISAGVVSTFAAMIIFMLLAGAFGYWRFEIDELPDLSFKFWAWAILGWVASNYIGAYVAGFAAGSGRSGDGALHGFVVWASSTVIVATALGILSGAFFSGFLAPVDSQGMCLVLAIFSILSLVLAFAGGKRGTRGAMSAANV